MPHRKPPFEPAPIGQAAHRGKGANPYDPNQTAWRGIRRIPARRIAQRRIGTDHLVPHVRGRDSLRVTQAVPRRHAHHRARQPHRSCRWRRARRRTRYEPLARILLPGPSSRRYGRVLPARAARRGPLRAAQTSCQQVHPHARMGHREPFGARRALCRPRAVLPHRSNRGFGLLGRHGGMQCIGRTQLRLRPRARPYLGFARSTCPR